MSKIIGLVVILLVTIVLSGVTFTVPLAFAKHHGSHHTSSSTASTTNVPAITQTMICTVTTTPGNKTITLTGGLPADVSCPVIESGVHVLYMHWYHSPGWLSLRGAFKTNYTEIDLSMVLYDSNHQVMNTPPKQYVTLTDNGNGIKSFDDPIANDGELVGAATYQLQGVFVVTP
jgi:hypothetical protein